MGYCSFFSLGHDTMELYRDTAGMGVQQGPRYGRGEACYTAEQCCDTAGLRAERAAVRARMAWLLNVSRYNAATWPSMRHDITGRHATRPRRLRHGATQRVTRPATRTVRAATRPRHCRVRAKIRPGTGCDMAHDTAGTRPTTRLRHGQPRRSVLAARVSWVCTLCT